ncbi:MAG: DnaD domain protein [Clostridiales bacterium]|nr:DnaD domain protein [Clostridiales bacterium]
MAMQRVQLNQSAVAIDGSTADRLIRLGSGDAALLYLYLARNLGEYDPNRAGSALHWSRSQLDTAMAQLQEVGLVSGIALPQMEEPVPRPEQAPEYSAADIVEELQDQGSQFSALLQETEKMLGRKLSSSNTAILLELYDHVGLPPEVLLLLINWLDGKNKRKYGPGKNLSMAYVRRVGYQWKERGYDTLEAADEYIKSCDLRESQEGAILSALGIYGRKPSQSEQRYLAQWLDWRFPPESVAVAYDITVTGLGRMDWRYCNAILRRWHEKNLHTPEEVRSDRKPETRSGSSRPYQRKAPPKDQKALERENRQSIAEMQRALAQMKEEN